MGQDHLRFAMARDSKNRVYINDIYDPNVGIDSYGTPKKKTYFGMLVYKPEDYTDQTFFVPNKYKVNLNADYTDISEYIGLQEPIKAYKQSLIKRGLILPPVANQ